MEWLFIIIGLLTIVTVAIAIYEGKQKRTLLAHDLNLRARGDAHSYAPRVQAEDATLHRINSLDR
ncbi:MAG: hypothetical protein P8P40_00385 [Sulfitobacter sp.]|nr:hypothetical protein [Sulfitobacter sp.]MDG1353004.1 hypothetical protein [Sulfitobacter sp.]